MSTNTLGADLEGSSFELFRHEPFIAFGLVKDANFSLLELNLSSEAHIVTKRALSGHWTSKDFKWL